MPSDTSSLPTEHLQHLRQLIEDTPSAAGVYIFHGEAERLPLYIGKSVNLRARLLSHLRNPDEVRMLRQTRRISHIRTAGDVGAQLLEARLIKEQQPLFNQRLRRTRSLCSLRLQNGIPEVVEARTLDFANTPDLYGLFASRHAALDMLRELADAQRLCQGALGLEKLARGRACFRASIGLCAGLCRGQEHADAHQARLLQGLEALRVQCWPHTGAVGLIEEDELGAQIHVVRNWCYLGSASHVDEARQLSRVAAGFDADGYRILVRPLLSGQSRLMAL